MERLLIAAQKDILNQMSRLGKASESVNQRLRRFRIKSERDPETASDEEPRRSHAVQETQIHSNTCRHLQKNSNLSQVGYQESWHKHRAKH